MRRREIDTDWDSLLPQIKEARKNRETWQQIGAKFGVSCNAVQTAMKRRGLPLRRPPAPKRKKITQPVKVGAVKKEKGFYPSFSRIRDLDRAIMEKKKPSAVAHSIFGPRLPRLLHGLETNHG